jgi:hypothetical protein
MSGPSVGQKLTRDHTGQGCELARIRVGSRHVEADWNGGPPRSREAWG